MKSTLLILACSCAIMAVSCQKNKQNPPAEPPQETTRVRLKLSGDILVNESPLSNGRKAGNDVSGARTYGSNTLYAVHMREYSGIEPLFTGLFSNPDSVYVDVPSSGHWFVSIQVYKKGTGGGLYYDLLEGLPYFPHPIGTELKNRMDSVTRFPYLRDSVAYTSIAGQTGSTRMYPEVEYFQGDVSFWGSINPAPITINVKRRSFGVQFSADNFTTGELLFEFAIVGEPVIDDLIVTPANISSAYRILAADDFRRTDSTKQITVRAKYKREPNGSFIQIASKEIFFKRNILTKLHIAVPEGTAAITTQITETDWSGNEQINF